MQKPVIAALAVALALLAAGPAGKVAPWCGADAALLNSDGAVDSDSPPWFCHNLDCPKYDVLETTDTYETREYQAGVWASTDVASFNFSMAVSTGFKRLFEYIDGANHEAVKVPMTAPVRTTVGAAAGPFCEPNFTVSFFIPFPFQKKGAPKPNNADVYLQEETASFVAYVAQKGGYVLDDWSVQKMVEGLTQALEADGKQFNTETFVIAGYDPPFRLAGRHNEVWLIATDAGQQSKQ